MLLAGIDKDRLSKDSPAPSEPSNKTASSNQSSNQSSFQKLFSSVGLSQNVDSVDQSTKPPPPPPPPPFIQRPQSVKLSGENDIRSSIGAPASPPPPPPSPKPSQLSPSQRPFGGSRPMSFRRPPSPPPLESEEVLPPPEEDPPELVENTLSPTKPQTRRISLSGSLANAAKIAAAKRDKSDV